MSYTIEGFEKDFVREHLSLLSSDEVLKQYSPDERLSGIAPDERLRGISPDEVLQQYSPDEVLKHYSLEEIRAFLEKSEKKITDFLLSSPNRNYGTRAIQQKSR